MSAAGAGSGRGRARGVLAVWLAVALVASAGGATARLHPPAPQLLLVALAVVLLVLERRVAWVRETIAGVSARGLVALHVTRFVGFLFLARAASGELPRDFAAPAGWGDIVVATLALALAATGGPDAAGRAGAAAGAAGPASTAPAANPRRGLYLAWNSLGLLDLLFVVGNAARHAMAAPASMTAMMRLPMSLLPLFLVPILLASHAWIYRRLLAPEAAA